MPGLTASWIRPLHLVIVDGLNPRLLRQELEAERLPAFGHLVRHGRFAEAVSTFPTVTPTCLASLATGLSPAEHGIAGIMWWDHAENRYVHYWPSPQSLWLGTFGQVMVDILLNLNGKHLAPSAPTVFELLEGAQVPCASINFPISRGPFLHRARVPWAMALIGRLPFTVALKGPRQQFVGDFTRPLLSLPRGLLGRYGISDGRAARYTRQTIKRRDTAFILSYLPENDLHSHRLGPMKVSKELQRLDRRIGEVMAAYGSWADATEQARWIIVGDHSQSEVGGFPSYSVDVYSALRGLKPVPFGRSGSALGLYDLAIAPNDRSALVYLARPTVLEAAIAEFSSWPSVDRIFWRTPTGQLSTQSPSLPPSRPWAYWCLDPVSQGQLNFQPGGPWQDEYGSAWSIRGDLEVLDYVCTDGVLHSGRYPNALERITGALNGPDLVLSARPGYEFTTGITMGRGNHGALLAEDSLTALISVGVDLPVRPRITDVMPAVLRAFGVPIGSPGHSQVEALRMPEI